MKHLQRFDELNKSTYLSAADKLKFHPSRANKLLKHAVDKGTDTVRERLYSHRFPSARDINEYYFICNCEIYRINTVGFLLEIKLESNWGSERDISRYAYIDHVDTEGKKFKFASLKDKNGDFYLFGDRIDALHLRKFLLEYFDDNKKYIKETFPNFESVDISINKMYADTEKSSFSSRKKENTKLNNFDLYYKKKSDK